MYKNNIYISGSSGFIGSNLVRHLRSRNFKKLKLISLKKKK